MSTRISCFICYRNMSKSVEISPEITMPMIGVGTWQMRDKEILYNVLDAALQCGYRFIDTAASYGNETFIGECLQSLLPKYGLKRSDLFITSKLNASDHGSGRAYEAGLRSLQNLGMEYLDLFIIHFPGVRGMNSDDTRIPELRKGSWLDLEKLNAEGKFRAIGVSNYMIRHLDELRTYASVWPPAVNQCEFHPYYNPVDLVKYCKQNGIHFQAYTSLGGVQNKHRLLAHPFVNELAEKYNCSPPQLLLAWAINQGISVLPKTTSQKHVVSNLQSININMTNDDIQKLAVLGVTEKFCWDPAPVV